MRGNLPLAGARRRARRGAFTKSGCGSCAEWLAWRWALAPRAAREHVRVAPRLPEPLIPGCENRRFLDAHHVHHWASGGETKLGNLVLLCRRHHRFVHEAGYSVVQHADGTLSFRDPWGGPIPVVPRPPPGDLDRLLEVNRDLEVDAWTCESGDGDPMDLDLTVTGLLQLRA